MDALLLPKLTDSQNRLLRLAFNELLGTGEPVTVETLAALTGHSPDAITGELRGLNDGGRVRLSGTGAVVGAFGLTVEPTRHQLLVNGVTRYTWCAIDALGILGALNATGSVTSRCPGTGWPIEIGFHDGQPCSGDLTCVVFIASYSSGTRVVDSWCPLVNFFADERTATQWAAERAVTGESVPLADATELASTRWRARLGHGPDGAAPGAPAEPGGRPEA